MEGLAPAPRADCLTVSDILNSVTWLADLKLPAGNRFGLPLCNGAGPQAGLPGTRLRVQH